MASATDGKRIRATQNYFRLADQGGSKSFSFRRLTLGSDVVARIIHLASRQRRSDASRGRPSQSILCLDPSFATQFGNLGDEASDRTLDPMPIRVLPPLDDGFV